MGYKPPPNKTTIAWRERQVWELRGVRGWSLARIAQKLDLSIEGVRKIAERVTQRETEQLSHDFRHLKTVHHHRHEKIYADCLQAYRLSCKPVRKARRSEGKDGQAVETSEVITREGNPHHLQVAMQALAADRELLGLNVVAAENREFDYTSEVAALEAEIAALESQERKAKSNEKAAKQETGGNIPDGPEGEAPGA